MLIKAKDPVREEFAGCSSGNAYYDSKSDAVSAFNEALEGRGYCLDHYDCNDWYGDEGRKNVRVLTGCYGDEEYGEYVGIAVFMWYRMTSGRWEIIGYLA